MRLAHPSIPVMRLCKAPFQAPKGAVSVAKFILPMEENELCDMYGALQGAVSYEQYIFCVLHIAYGALQGAVNVADSYSSYHSKEHASLDTRTNLGT